MFIGLRQKNIAKTLYYIVSKEKKNNHNLLCTEETARERREEHVYTWWHFDKSIMAWWGISWVQSIFMICVLSILHDFLQICWRAFFNHPFGKLTFTLAAAFTHMVFRSSEHDCRRCMGWSYVTRHCLWFLLLKDSLDQFKGQYKNIFFQCQSIVSNFGSLQFLTRYSPLQVWLFHEQGSKYVYVSDFTISFLSASGQKPSFNLSLWSPRVADVWSWLGSLWS